MRAVASSDQTSTRFPDRRKNPRRSSMPCVWSACSWLNRTPSISRTPHSSICSRKSGDVSISTRVSPCLETALIKTEQRRRRFFEFKGSHWPQSFPIRGTPPEDPQPSMVTVFDIANCLMGARTLWRKAGRNCPLSLLPCLQATYF